MSEVYCWGVHGGMVNKEMKTNIYEVDHVYNNYKFFCPNRKATRLQWFKRSFTEFLNLIESGVPITEKTDHYQYLYSRRKRNESEESKHRNILKIIKTETDLYFDIKQRGMIDPIAIIGEDDKFYIERGHRRLMILKFLGQKTFRAEITGRRKDLYVLFNKMGFKEGAEIGVLRGANAINMFKNIPGLKLYLIDTWNGRARHYYKKAARKLSLYKDNAIVMRKTSLEASFEIPDGSLDFVYIDADHSYGAVMLDIILWSPKVRAGGILSGHDYGLYPKFGVKDAVDDYSRYHKLDLKLFSTSWYWEK